MNIVSEAAQLSLAQRIAKVRNCMLVEVATGVSVTDKDLFVSLCQIYEQNSVEASYAAGASSQNALGQASPFLHLTAERILPDGPAGMLGKDIPLREHRVGFSIVRWPNMADFEDFDDWDDNNRPR